MNGRLSPTNRIFLAPLLFVGALLVLYAPCTAQDTVTGAFEGTVTDSLTAQPIAGAEARIINQETNVTILKRSDSRGRFYQGLLSPGLYTIRVSAPNYKTAEIVQRLFITRTGEVVPVPVTLDPLPAGVPVKPATTATPMPGATPVPGGIPTPGVPAITNPATPLPATPPAATATPLSEADTDLRARINATDARRGGSFTEEQVSTLPLGGETLVRTFDELTLLLPGVADPPQTLGSVAGPGVGSGVGSAGQFAVNGLRSRANNFTVDGSDNNDEDIGVRRQGFVDLNSQPIESVKEYQAITLLAPAQFGRNIGAQVNAVSKSGGNDLHGTIYGFFNASQLNARNFFDGPAGTGPTALMAGPNNNQHVQLCDSSLAHCNDMMMQNPSKGKDSLTFYQGGLALGGPVKPDVLLCFPGAGSN